MSDFNTEAMNTLMDAELAKAPAPVAKVDTTVVEEVKKDIVADVVIPTPDAAIIPTPAPDAKVETPDHIAELLKELNLSSIDDLKAAVTKSTKKEETPEEKETKQKLYQASLDKYAQEKGIISRDEIVKLETLKTADKQDILFKEFEAKNKEKYATKLETNPDALKEAFERKYHINSGDAEDEEFGQSKIEDDFNKLINPLQSKYEKAKSSFDDEEKIKSTMPVFNDYITKTINSTIKDSIKVFEKKVDDETIVFEKKLTPELKKEIFEEVLKEVSDLPNFLSYMNDSKDGKNSKIEKAVANAVELAIHRKSEATVYEDIWEKGLKKGTAKGSNNGSEVPFALNKKQNTAIGGGDSQDTIAEMIESTKRLKQ